MPRLKAGCLSSSYISTLSSLASVKRWLRLNGHKAMAVKAGFVLLAASACAEEPARRTWAVERTSSLSPNIVDLYPFGAHKRGSKPILSLNLPSAYFYYRDNLKQRAQTKIGLALTIHDLKPVPVRKSLVSNDTFTVTITEALGSPPASQPARSGEVRRIGDVAFYKEHPDRPACVEGSDCEFDDLVGFVGATPSARIRCFRSRSCAMDFDRSQLSFSIVVDRSRLNELPQLASKVLSFLEDYEK
ncbi:hypothetical protein [Sphingomonas sp. LHG3406-1]|uniref:hypothetical protein n=1 Tax=Sphingomonas sp. LHG3406-1 TaxID=2804617 RepID=UPI00262FEE43|nr:hypothetical protein [Sphingomonas sp. LHG3406-1]